MMGIDTRLQLDRYDEHKRTSAFKTWPMDGVPIIYLYNILTIFMDLCSKNYY
jgi:hypothetical protein